MDKTIPEIIHEINDHLLAVSAALTELEKRTEPDKPTTVGELAKRLGTLHIN